MLQVSLKPLQHRQRECIGIYFSSQPLLNGIVKKLPGIHWSRTYTCWYLPLSRDNYQMVVKAIGRQACIDSNELKIYLERKKKVAATLPPTVSIARYQPIKVYQPANTAPGLVTLTALSAVSENNLHALELFVQQLKLKAYSPATIRTYRNEFCQLLQAIGQKPVENLTVPQLKRYMVFAMEKHGISENTAHSRLNALKFYFEQVLGRERFFWEIPRPKKPYQLPKVFSQDEIAAIIKSVQNIKHKTMLMLAYSAGLRVSEVVSLKTYDIDSRRMTIFLSAAKGKKDRVVALSPLLLVILREYARLCNPNKKGYLFEGAEKGKPYSSRSLQEVLAEAKQKAGIMRPGSIHSLRHSFATHLVERGTDVTMIQKLMGHNDIKTTMRYLHTSNKDLLKIMSPLDDLPL